MSKKLKAMFKIVDNVASKYLDTKSYIEKNLEKKT